MQLIFLILVASIAGLGQVLTVILRLFIHSTFLVAMKSLIHILGLISRRDLSHLQGLKDQRVVASIVTSPPFVDAARIWEAMRWTLVGVISPIFILSLIRSFMVIEILLRCLWDSGDFWHIKGHHYTLRAVYDRLHCASLRPRAMEIIESRICRIV